MACVIINIRRCKGCGLCVEACPRQILCMSTDQMNAKGYAPAECIDQSRCTGCAACARMCPECAIEVEK